MRVGGFRDATAAEHGMAIVDANGIHRGLREH